MKNIIKIFALALFIAVIVTAFSACESNDNEAPYVIRTYVNDAQRIIVVMSDGSEIDAGPALEDELPAPNIKKLYVNTDYHLIVEYSDGRTADMGYVGIKDDTVDEPVTVTSTEVNAEKELIVRYSDGTEKNLGYVGVEVIKEVEKIVEIEVEIPIFTVTFLGKDGEVLSEQYVIRGKDAKAPEAPEYEHFSFKAWDKQFLAVSGDLTVRATYEEAPKYLVVFEGKDGAILDMQMVYEGAAASAPEPPEIVGNQFMGWDCEFDDIRSDLTVKANYKVLEHYKVYFIDINGEIIQHIYVKEGCPAIAPEAPYVEGYEFCGWSQDTSCVTSEMFVHAIYEKIEKFTVTFKGKYGETLSSQEVIKGEAASAPSVPAIIGYNFTGWDKDFSSVQGDITVTAVYDEVGYFTVTFKDKDGNVLYESLVNAGCAAVSPEAPSVDGFVFVGWDKDFSNVTENMEINATYEEALQGETEGE